MRNITNLKSLEELDIGDNYLLEHEDIETIVALPNLKSLNMNGTPLCDQGVQALVNNTTLERFNWDTAKNAQAKSQLSAQSKQDLHGRFSNLEFSNYDSDSSSDD